MSDDSTIVSHGKIQRLIVELKHGDRYGRDKYMFDADLGETFDWNVISKGQLAEVVIYFYSRAGSPTRTKVELFAADSIERIWETQVDVL